MIISNKLTIGILAHVDAGKTTLAESLLYNTGTIKELGRVDNKNAFLDTYHLEKQRGITIFSKQAEFDTGEKHVTLLDTPGHADFSAEMERTLQVLDYGILVISGAEGIQGHTVTLWRLLAKYNIPTFIFINKMDRVGSDRDALMISLKERLTDGCVDICGDDAQEEIATCSEELLEKYLGGEDITAGEAADYIKERKLFPCVFGSALKNEGVDVLIDVLEKYTLPQSYSDEFGGRVFKISRDKDGSRLTHIKLTGGNLAVKTFIEEYEEKVDRIRIYNGEKFENVNEVQAGTVCCLTGLTNSGSGDILGSETEEFEPVLEPVMDYELLLPEDVNIHEMYSAMQILEEEDPQLHVIWDDRNASIHAQLMGEVQIEVLREIISERFGVTAEFGIGSIVYKETITNTVEGVGHYEPLRHYSEVHLLLEPGSRGSGMVFDTDVPADELEQNWQNLIITHLGEIKHRGVLTGSEITDMKITVIGGKAHLKHTEPGDFRQSTYRAVRQGLMQADSVLLEPVYDFRLEVPADMIGRAMGDVQKMYGECDSPVIEGEMGVVTGKAPVATMNGYFREVLAYSHGLGSLACTLSGYEVCHNADEIIDELGYDAERDTENPSGSIFCAHGAGFFVPWNEVEDYMHVPKRKLQTNSQEDGNISYERITSPGRPVETGRGMDKELERIFEKTYGPKNRSAKTNINRSSTRDEYFEHVTIKDSQKKGKYVIVDGYNIIYDWKDILTDDLPLAREKLIEMMCNYKGARDINLVLVFDAYRVKDNPGREEEINGIKVVYTKEKEKADQYIEKMASELSCEYDVKVATSDYLEQLVIFGAGARRISAREFREEVMTVEENIRRLAAEKGKGERNLVFRDALEKKEAKESED